MMGSWIGITLIKVGGASACGGLEAEGQEYFALCLSPSFLRINSVILKRSTPCPEAMPFCFFAHYSTIPTFHHSMWIGQIDRDKKSMILIYCKKSEEVDVSSRDLGNSR